MRSLPRARMSYRMKAWYESGGGGAAGPAATVRRLGSSGRVWRRMTGIRGGEVGTLFIISSAKPGCVQSELYPPPVRSCRLYTERKATIMSAREGRSGWTVGPSDDRRHPDDV